MLIRTPRGTDNLFTEVYADIQKNPEYSSNPDLFKQVSDINRRYHQLAESNTREADKQRIGLTRELLKIQKQHPGFTKLSARPHVVDEKQLTENKFLLPMDQRNYILSKAKNDKYFMMSKQNEELPELQYEIMTIGNQVYAVYPDSLGKGNFGEVSAAQNIKTGEWVAIKTLEKISEAKDEFKQLSIQNAAFGMLPLMESAKIAMEYVSGQSLERYVKSLQDNDLSAVQWMNIMENMYQAMRNVHAHGQIHRDVKPANMHIDPETLAVKFIDFGFATEAGIDAETGQLTTGGLPMGSGGYMAPELKGGFSATYSESSDYYALAIAMGQVLGVVRENYETVITTLQENNGYIAAAENKTPTPRKFLGYEIVEYNQVENPVLPPELMKPMIDLLKRMHDPDPLKRPKPEEIQQILSKLKHQCLELMGLISSKAIVEYDALFSQDGTIKPGIASQLKSFNSIEIINPPDQPNIIEKIKEQVKSSNLPPTKIYMDAIDPNFLNYRDHGEAIVDCVYLSKHDLAKNQKEEMLNNGITPIPPKVLENQEMNSYRQTNGALITVNQYELVTKALYQELERAQQKLENAKSKNQPTSISHYEHKIDLIKKTMTTLGNKYKDDKLNHAILKDNLKSLEKALLQSYVTKTPMQKMFTNLGVTNNVVKRMKDLNKAIEKENIEEHRPKK